MKSIKHKFRLNFHWNLSLQRNLWWNLSGIFIHTFQASRPPLALAIDCKHKGVGGSSNNYLWPLRKPKKSWTMNTFENREGMDVSRASFFWAGSMDGHQKSHLNGICQRNLRPSCPKWGDKVPDFLLGSLPPPREKQSSYGGRKLSWNLSK